MEPQGSHVAVPEAVGHTEFSTTALARLLANGMRDELLGISTELIHDLLRTGQLGSAKAGRRRLIGKHHLEAFLASGQ